MSTQNINTKDWYIHQINDLRHLALANDLSLATRRLMDFLADLRIEESALYGLKQQAIVLRANFNQVGSKEEENMTDESRKDLWLNYLALLDVLEQLLLEGTNSTEKLVTTFEDAQVDFLKDKYLIFNPENGKIASQLPIFEAKDLLKTYAGVGFTLGRIDLTLQAGEITGIVGENGNGKTTLLRIVAGELSIDDGEILYPTLQTLPKKKDWYAIKQHIAFIPQHLPAWTGLLKDNLHLSAANHGLFGQDNVEAVDFIIHRLGLSRYHSATWKDISSGYKLRFELAKALVWRPQLLILDEPLANLDINAKLMFMQDLRLLANSLRYPITILMSSQQLHEIENVVDNIIFLQEGKPIYNGKVSEFGQDRLTNIFELSGNFSRIELYQWFKEQASTFLQTVQIEDTGQSFIVETPIDFTGNQLLALIASKKKIDYFRDISQSTRKLFQK